MLEIFMKVYNFFGFIKGVGLFLLRKHFNSLRKYLINMLIFIILRSAVITHSNLSLMLEMLKVLIQLKFRRLKKDMR